MHNNAANLWPGYLVAGNANLALPRQPSLDDRNGKYASMTYRFNRRGFVKGLAGSACLAPLLPALSLGAASTGLQHHVLGERLGLITGAGGNVTVFHGDQGLTLVDSGSADHTQALLDMVSDLAGNGPVSNLFNTHWHDEHTGGNEAFQSLGSRIIAHENTRLWMTADFEVHWRNKVHKPRSTEALPSVTFYSHGQMDLGGESVRYYHGSLGHTDGDIWLHFPDSNVLVAGGLASNYRYPICDIATGGWIGGLISVNAEMLKIANDDTLIVPDRGPAIRKRDLQAQYDMLSDLYEKMKQLARDGFSGQDMLAETALTAAYDPVWGDPAEFVLETYRGMWAHTYDMGGFI